MIKNTKHSRLYILLGILVLVSIGAILFLYRPAFPAIDQDPTYHFVVAQSFVRDGGVNMWENWDRLPVGRPHLYPPVFQVIITPFVSMHMTPLAAIRLIDCVTIVVLLLLSWIGMVKLFTPRMGLCYLIVATSFVPFIISIGGTAPASIVLLLSPFLILFMKKGRTAAFIVLLALLLYVHMVFPWFVIAALVIWVCFNKQYLKTTLRAIGISILLYLPWLIYVCANLDYLRYFKPTYFSQVVAVFTPSFNLSLFLICALCLAILGVKWKQNLKGKDITYFVALLIVSLPVAYFEFGRFAASLGIWPMMVIIAYVISDVAMERLQRILMLILVGMSVITCVYIRSYRSQLSIVVLHHSMLIAPFLSGDSFFLSAPQGHLTTSNMRVAQAISDSTGPDAVVVSVADVLDHEVYPDYRQFSLTQIFAALSDRRMANPLPPRFYWQDGLDPHAADVLIVNKYQIDPATGFLATSTGYMGSSTVDLTSDFKLIAESGPNLLVYKNLNKTPVTIPGHRFMIPLWLAWIVITGAGIYVLAAGSKAVFFDK
jgi:hypothetical protein